MLQKIYEANAGRGLEIVGITHERGGMDAIRDYIGREKITFPVTVGDMPVAVSYLALSREKPSYHVPAFVFIDRQGRIAEERFLENAGDREWFTKLEESLEATVEKLLGLRTKVQSPKSKLKKKGS